MGRWSITLIVLCIVALVISSCSVQPITEEEASPHPYGTATSEHARSVPSVRLGFHYRPLSDNTSQETLAQQASFMILSKNDEAYRDSLRGAGYNGLVLQYVLSNEIDGPKALRGSDDCNAEFKPWQNQAANQIGDFCNYIHPYGDWFLHNSRGERLYETWEGRTFYHMNPRSEGWRKFMLDRLKQRMFGDETTAPLGYDGIFFDNLELSMRKAQYQLTNSDGTVQEYASDEEFRAAWSDWLRYMRKGLGTTVPIWANMVAGRETGDEWNIFLPDLDGMMNEAFVTGYDSSPLTPVKQTNSLKQAEYAISQGKGVYLIAQGARDDLALQQFALASYLLVMQPDADTYFRYTKARAGGYDEWWTYANYGVELGLPIGPRYKIKNGWRRDFVNGYVTVDQVERTGTIVQQQSAQPTPDNQEDS